MTRTLRIITYLLLVFNTVPAIAKGNKDGDKEKKAIDKEEYRFRRNVDKDPYNAAVYLDHANALAAFNSEAARAQSYYQAALRLDSANAGIYKDYGRYLTERLRLFDDAKAMFSRSLQLAPGDQETAKYLATVNKLIEMQEDEAKLRDFGKSTTRELDSAVSYKVKTSFDSLKKVSADDEGRYGYHSLLGRYLDDDPTLSPAEMYLLIIGYSRQKEYNPFNYNDIFELKMIAAHDLDSAISSGRSLTLINPLNPSLNREMMYYYRKKNDTANADRYLGRIRQFFSGVLYSGNGSCEKPYVSLWAKEEYNLISYLGLKASDSHSMGMCAGQMAEIIELKDAGADAGKYIHFNVALIYMQTVGK